MRADGSFYIEFQVNAHDKNVDTDIGTVGDVDEPQKVDKITGLPMTEKEMFGAAG